MRKLTEDENHMDSTMSDSELAMKWRMLKRALFHHYVTMRYFDIVIEGDTGKCHISMCNNVGGICFILEFWILLNNEQCREVQGESKFQTCAAYRNVFYCSKKC